MSQSDDPILDQEEIEAQRAGAQAASQLAAKRAKRGQGQLLQQISDPDIFDGNDEVLGDIFGPDFSRSHVLGQKEEADVWRHRWLNENEAERIIHEANPGRLCFGPFLALAQGVHNRDPEPQKPMTDVAKRKIRQTADAKTAYQSMAKDGRTFKGVTEIVTTSKVEREGENSNDRGRIGKLRDKMFG